MYSKEIRRNYFIFYNNINGVLVRKAPGGLYSGPISNDQAAYEGDHDGLVRITAHHSNIKLEIVTSEKESIDLSFEQMTEDWEP